jgi:hypothetical protein
MQCRKREDKEIPPRNILRTKIGQVEQYLSKHLSRSHLETGTKDSPVARKAERSRVLERESWIF